VRFSDFQQGNPPSETKPNHPDKMNNPTMTPRQQREHLFAIREQDARSPYNLISASATAMHVPLYATTPREQRDVLFRIDAQDAPSPFVLKLAA